MSGDIRIKARAWMVENKIRNVEIQRDLELKQHTQVSLTMSGKRNHRQVLQYLLDRGCPAEYLDLPNDMRKAA